MTKVAQPCSFCGKSLRSDNKSGYCGKHSKLAPTSSAKTYYQRNRERILERTTAYNHANPEKRAAWAKELKARHPERSAKYTQTYRDKNPDACLAKVRKWRAANKDKANAATDAWRADNKDKCRSYDQNRRARKAGNGGSHTGAERSEVFEFYGWRCCNCAADLLALPESDRHLDHIVPISLGGRNDTGNLQAMCKPCNSRKGARKIC